MTETDILLRIGDVLLVLGGAALVVFAASYAAFFNWRRNPAGRAVMGLVLMLIIILGYNFTYALVGPDVPGREWIRIAIYGAFCLAAGRMVLTLWRSWGDTPKIESKS
jgi:hypothetical protein